MVKNSGFMVIAKDIHPLRLVEILFLSTYKCISHGSLPLGWRFSGVLTFGSRAVKNTYLHGTPGSALRLCRYSANSHFTAPPTTTVNTCTASQLEQIGLRSSCESSNPLPSVQASLSQRYQLLSHQSWRRMRDESSTKSESSHWHTLDGKYLQGKDSKRPNLMKSYVTTQMVSLSRHSKRQPVKRRHNTPLILAV